MVVCLAGGFSLAEQPVDVEAWEIRSFGGEYLGQFVKVTNLGVTHFRDPYHPLSSISVTRLPWVRTGELNDYWNDEAEKWAMVLLSTECHMDSTGAYDCAARSLEVAVLLEETRSGLKEAYRAALHRREYTPAEVTGYIVYVPPLGEYILIANQLTFPSLGLEGGLPLAEFLARPVPVGTLAQYLLN